MFFHVSYPPNPILCTLDTATFACVNWSNFKTYLALTLVSLFYGINYSVLKIVVPSYIGAYGFIVFRVILATVFFSLFNALNYEKIDWKKDGIRLALCALTGVTINQLLFFKGISLTSAVNGSIIMTLTPVLVMAWAALLTGEKITLKKFAGVLLGMIGAVIILYKGGIDLSQGNWRGDLLVLINGTSYACYLVLVKPLMNKYRPMTVITWVFAIAIPFVIPVGLDEALQANWGQLPPKVWFSIAYAIVFVTVVVYFLNTWTLARVSSSVVGAFIYLQPVFATATAIIFFDEVLLVKHFVAAGFIFLGVWLVIHKKEVKA